MFKVRKTSDEQLMKSMRWCHEEYFGRGLIDSKGLRVDPVPEVEDIDIEWHESGLAGYSKQSRKVFGFSLLDDLMGRK